MRSRMIPFILLGTMLLAGCNLEQIRGSGNVVEDTREVSSFEIIDVCCGMELTLSQGAKPSLRIEAEDNLIDDILVKQSGDTVTVEFDDLFSRSFRPTKPVKVFVTMPEISGVIVSGGGRVDADEIQSQGLSFRLSGGSEAFIHSAVATSLEVDISGGGRFELNNLEGGSAQIELTGGSDATFDALEVDDIEFSVSGGGTVEGQRMVADLLKLGLSGGSEAKVVQFSGGDIETDISGGGGAEMAGDADSHTIDLSGGSTFDGPDLRTAMVEVKGNGDALVWATDTLTVDLSGGGTVEYYGNPEIRSDLSGGSEVKPLGGR